MKNGVYSNEQEEIERCKESLAYFYNKYLLLKDKNGNVLPKKEVTDEELDLKLNTYLKWKNSRRI